MIQFKIQPTRQFTIFKDEKIHVGDSNIRYNVELPNAIGNIPIRELSCELRFYLDDSQYVAVPINTRSDDNHGFITSELTGEARTLKVLFKFMCGDFVGKTNAEDLPIHQSYAGEPAPTPSGNLDDFIGGKLSSVTSNLEAIPDFAFSGKTDLEEVNLPNATYIGKYAFSSAPAASSASGSGSSAAEGGEDEEQGEDDLVFNNKKLRSVNMNSVTHIAESAFEGDENLEISVLPDSLVVIGNRAFKDCPKVNINSLPENISYIGDLALSQNLDFSLFIDKDISYIGSGTNVFLISQWLRDNVFTDNKLDISKIPVKMFNTEIGTGVAYGNPGNIFRREYLLWDSYAEDQVIPEGILSIPDFMFSGVFSMGRENPVYLRLSNVVHIGNHAFENCSSISSEDFETTVETIGSNAFAGCGLQTINFRGALRKLGEGAFARNESLGGVYFDTMLLTEIPAYCFFECLIGYFVNALPSTINYIGRCAFNAFGNSNACDARFCNSLVLEDEAFENNNFSSILLPSSLRRIPMSCFQGSLSVTQLEIPEGVSNVGTYAFASCQALEKVIFNYVQGDLTLEGDLFAYCQAIRVVDFSKAEDVPSVYSEAFLDFELEGFSIIVKNNAMKEAFCNATNWAEYAEYIKTVDEYEQEVAANA